MREIKKELVLFYFRTEAYLRYSLYDKNAEAQRRGEYFHPIESIGVRRDLADKSAYGTTQTLAGRLTPQLSIKL